MEQVINPVPVEIESYVSPSWGRPETTERENNVSHNTPANPPTVAAPAVMARLGAPAASQAEDQPDLTADTRRTESDANKEKSGDLFKTNPLAACGLVTTGMGSVEQAVELMKRALAYTGEKRWRCW